MKHHPVQLEPPDIAPYRRGNARVDYVHVFDSGRRGPNVMLQALTHGNEFCGAIALDYLLTEGVRPRAGRLTLAFANVAAYERFDFDDPDRSRFIDEDYNRVWGDEQLHGPRDSAELRRARALSRFVEQADLLLDTGHPAGLRMIERGDFDDPQSTKAAVLLECGQHWERSAVEVALDTALRFLKASGAVDAAWADSRLRLEPPAQQRLIRVMEPVVAKTMQFRFARDFGGLEVLPVMGTLVATDGETQWRTPYDDCVMVMPSMAHLKPGTTMVRLGRYA